MLSLPANSPSAYRGCIAEENRTVKPWNALVRHEILRHCERISRDGLSVLQVKAICHLPLLTFLDDLDESVLSISD